MSTRNNIAIKIFDELVGCEARIRSNGLLIEGHLEGDVLLAKDPYNKGLQVLSELEWNTKKPLNSARTILLSDGKLNLSYEQKERLDELIEEYKPNLRCQIASISPYGVQSIKLQSDKEGKIQSVNVQYENVLITIQIIKHPSKEDAS